jgi:hypothetical protein
VEHGAGENLADKRLVELAQTSGTFQFDYQTYSAEDRKRLSGFKYLQRIDL